MSVFRRFQTSFKLQIAGAIVPVPSVLMNIYAILCKLRWIVGDNIEYNVLGLKVRSVLNLDSPYRR